MTDPLRGRRPGSPPPAPKVPVRPPAARANEAPAKPPAAVPQANMAEIFAELEAEPETERRVEEALQAIPDAPTLQLGAKGAAVREVQAFLQAEGYLSGPIDGVFTEDTARAVEWFQVVAELEGNGRVEGETWKRIRSTGALTPDRAGREAIAILVARIPEGEAPQTDGREILGLGLNANEPVNDFWAPIADRHIGRNGRLLLERLNAPERKAQLDAVFATVAHDPLATLGLQVLLLTDEPAQRAPLLAALHHLATDAPLHPAISRQDLVAQLVRDIAAPASINQQARGTCTVTTLQIYMAMEDPAELVRIVGGLASPAGEVTLRGGQVLTRLPGTEAPATLLEKKRDGTTSEIEDRRPIPNRLWAPAFMELANGDDAYSNTLDERASNKVSGLYRWETDRAFDAVTGADSELVLAREPGALEPAMERLRTVTGGGKPVPVGLKWGSADASGEVHGNHELLVTRVSGRKVYYHNPWGQEEAMALDEFKKRLNELHLPPAR